LPGLPVEGQEFTNLAKRVDLRGNKNWLAHTPEQFKRIDTVRSEPYRRIGLLHGFGNHSDVVYLPKLPLIRTALMRPGVAYQFHAFQHPLTTFGLIEAKTREVRWNRSAPNAKLDPSVTQDI
jgi:hypothetical protein